MTGRLADIVGVDFYPRRWPAGPVALYLDGSRTPWQQRRRARLLDGSRRLGGG